MAWRSQFWPKLRKTTTTAAAKTLTTTTTATLTTLSHTRTHTYTETEATCARLADTTRLHVLRNLNNNKKLSNKLLNKKSYLWGIATPHRGNLVKKTWKITHINSSALLPLLHHIHLYLYVCTCYCSHCVCYENKSNENAQSGNIFRFLIRRKKLIFVILFLVLLLLLKFSPRTKIIIAITYKFILYICLVLYMCIYFVNLLQL